MKVKLNDKTIGILCIISAAFFFALMNLFLKLAGDLPTFEKAFFRNAIAAIFSISILAKNGYGFKIGKGNTKYLVARSFFGTLGLVCNFYAVDHIPISDASMLNKLSPFFALIFSYFILKEKPNKVEWLALIAAFIGAVFVAKPTLSLASVPAFLGVLGGLGAGIAYTNVRILGKRGEFNLIVVMFFSTFSSLFILPFMLVNFELPTLTQLMFLILTGVSATFAQISVTKAYTKAPAKEISVFDYSQVIFAALFGFAFLGELPDKFSIIGYIIIISVAIAKTFYNLKTE